MAGGGIIVIGSGMAGLACARVLADAGHAPLVLDKGRGIGGRLATRRAEGGLQFDHGAQYVRPDGDGFRSAMAEMRRAGAADTWEDGSGAERQVGRPGMNALAKHLGARLDIRQSAEVTAATETPAGWEVSVGAETLSCGRLVITVPAPQASALLGPDHDLAPALSAVRFAPCLTLMAAFSAGEPAPFVSRRDPEDALSWIALDSSKPSRPAHACWVAQGSADWSAAHLEHDREEIARLMLPLLCNRLGMDASQVLHAAAHRWRYANVTEALGRPFLRNDASTLWLAGDWCLGPRVEAAWTSGTAVAQDIGAAA